MILIDIIHRICQDIQQLAFQSNPEARAALLLCAHGARLDDRPGKKSLDQTCNHGIEYKGIKSSI